MTKARQLADLLDSSGDVKASALDNTSSDLVDDSTPQLGGDLDLNNSDITGTGDINITGTVTADDNITLEGASTPRLKITDATNTAQAFLEAGNTVARVGSLSDHNFEIRTNNDLAIEVKNNGDITFFGDDEVTQGLRWDASTQRLGLGTTSPSTLLHLQSTDPRITLTDTSLSGNANHVIRGADQFLEISADDGNSQGTSSMRFKVDGSEHMRIDSSGNMGIGSTSTGGFKLDVAGTARANNLVFRTNTSAPSGDAGIFRPADGALGLSTNNAERLRILSNGNVGIGSDSPTAIGSNNITLQINGANTSNTGAVRLRSTDNSVDTALWANSTATFLATVSNHPLTFRTNNTERMRLDTSGNLGIGTSAANSFSSDANNLVVGSGSGNEGITINSGSSGNGAIFFAVGTAGNNAYRGQVDYDHNNDRLMFATAATERMRIDSSGNVLVGKTSSASAATTEGLLLAEDGRIFSTYNTSGADAPFTSSRTSTAGDGRHIRFFQAGTQVGNIQTTSSGTIYNTTSDARLKTDIAPIADATDKLMAMNAVTHKWKADPDADAVVGFIAQEMQEIVPEAVSGDADSDDMMSMDYGRITPVLVAALQDAHRKIEQLEQRIADMETE